MVDELLVGSAQGAFVQFCVVYAPIWLHRGKHVLQPCQVAVGLGWHPGNILPVGSVTRYFTPQSLK